MTQPQSFFKILLILLPLCLCSCYSHKALMLSGTQSQFQEALKPGKVYRLKLKDGRTRELKLVELTYKEFRGETLPYRFPEKVQLDSIASAERRKLNGLAIGSIVVGTGIAIITVIGLFAMPTSMGGMMFK
ncbi:MAG: hypothetical protein JST14_08585 [Bacteroidetes bacterium]|nr:hypothetical protein [Bacteroidota bacterium]